MQLTPITAQGKMINMREIEITTIEQALGLLIRPIIKLPIDLYVTNIL